MRASLRTLKPLLCLVFGSFILFGENALSQSESMDCTKVPKTHVALAQGDQNSASHLQVIRKIATGASVNLDLCEADLTIKGGKDDLLRVAIDLDNRAPKFLAGDYLQALDVTPQGVTVKLYLPKRPRAKVIVVLPAATPSLQLNLVQGNLSFETDRVAGEGRINVVSGHVDVLANEDSYTALHASVLLGGFHDHRHVPDEAHGIVSKSLSGKGKGSIDVNVVRGSLDIRAWD
jgi:hypothetical protein